jgi:hypothetical protein
LEKRKKLGDFWHWNVHAVLLSGKMLIKGSL